MSLFKFSTFLIFFSLFTQAQLFAAGFSGQECLKANFSTQVRHKGQPFGLAENILEVDKRNCLVKINHKKMRFLKEYWEIDVCRGPIHVKSGTGAVDVARRSGDCSRTDDSAFCQELRTLESVLQNDGLIFADGAKEELNDPHGMIYCSYLLLQKYLRVGKILSSEGNDGQVDLGSGLFDESGEQNFKTQAPDMGPVSEEEKKEAPFPETEELGNF
jgi:hypothetical protein